MAAKWYEYVTGTLAQKRQYRRVRARIDALPEPHRGAARALERYVQYAGGITDGDTSVQMLNDLADLWERASADSTSVRDIVGDDPVAFAEDFTSAYSAKQWIDRERARLGRAIDEAERRERR